MSDEDKDENANNNPELESREVPDQPGAEGDVNGPGKQPDPEDNSDEQAEDSLPEKWRNELKKARGDAAKYRTALRDAQKKLEGAKTPDEYESAVNELKSQNAKLERDLIATRVASTHNLPPDFADRLVGTTQAELEADAAKLAKILAGTRDTNLRGGLDPTDDSPGATTDPRKLAQRIGR